MVALPKFLFLPKTQQHIPVRVAKRWSTYRPYRPPAHDNDNRPVFDDKTITTVQTVMERRVGFDTSSTRRTPKLGAVVSWEIPKGTPKAANDNGIRWPLGRLLSLASTGDAP